MASQPIPYREQSQADVGMRLSKAVQGLAVEVHRHEAFRVRIVVGMFCFCAAAGLLTIFSSVRALLTIWRTDDLKSMGLAVPFVSFGLILRAWRRLGWEADGSWWGVAVLAGAATLVFLRDQTLLILTVNKDWLLQVPPLPLVAVVYALGLTVVFGGRRLLRAAWFPVLLMWAVIPVPQTFSRRVDLPLQHASASVARAFAHGLGQPLTSDKLRLMFTPDFGMFIAPGCNGIRGAVTLGLAALVVSYLYRFRLRFAVPAIAGAVLLGYVFNFLRLCLLVVYYRIALPHPWMQTRAKSADFAIGGTLFLMALLIFFAVANRLRREQPQPIDVPGQPWVPLRPLLLRVAAVLVLSAVFGMDALHTVHAETVAAALAPLPSELPAHIGAWTRTRTWTDATLEGTVVYLWGEYTGPVSAGGGALARVSLGISPVLGVHDAEVCHIARGEEPGWHGQLDLASLGGAVALTAATYNNGRVQKLEASTVCDGGVCRQFSESGEHITLVYGRPHRNLPIGGETGRPVPLLLKVESPNAAAPAAAVEPLLAAQLGEFLRGANLPELAARFRRR